MNLKQYFLTNNNCYKQYKKHTVKGIMVHSTGANNPYLKRYVNPDDGALGKNLYNNHWNQPTPDGQSKCVHAFIGKLDNGTIATYQTLPWDIVGWHSGTGSLGSVKNANNTGYIGFEICEDGLNDPSYFNAVYKEAVELCAYLCKLYKLDPLKNIICHSEGAKLGIASNHGDVMHWFPKHGKNMDTFRNDVKKLMESGGNDTVEKAILIFTQDDLPVAKRLQGKIGNCAIFFRNDDENKTAPADVMKVKQLFIVGGSGGVGHPNEVLLQGSDWYATIAAVEKYIKGKN